MSERNLFHFFSCTEIHSFYKVYKKEYFFSRFTRKPKIYGERIKMQWTHEWWLRLTVDWSHIVCDFFYLKLIKIWNLCLSLRWGTWLQFSFRVKRSDPQSHRIILGQFYGLKWGRNAKWANEKHTKKMSRRCAMLVQRANTRLNLLYDFSERWNEFVDSLANSDNRIKNKHRSSMFMKLFMFKRK